MRFKLIMTIAIAAILLIPAMVSIGAPAQKDDKGANPKDKEKSPDETAAPELLTPNFMSSKYGFGIFVPEGFASTVTEEPKVLKYTPKGATKPVTQKADLWMLGISSRLGDPTEPSARLTIEKLPTDVTDVGGFWKTMKDRDPLMEHNTTYERVAKVAQTGAIQARVERMEGTNYILAIIWIWVHDGNGYTLTGYPPKEGNNDQARDIVKNLIDQFRWMTAEEIKAVKEAPPSKPPEKTRPKFPPGRPF